MREASPTGQGHALITPVADVPRETGPTRSETRTVIDTIREPYATFTSLAEMIALGGSIMAPGSPASSATNVVNEPRSMGEWIFAPDTLLDRRLRVGAGGILIAMIVAAELGAFLTTLDKFVPSDIVQFLVCIAVFLFLVLPPWFFANPKDAALRDPTLTIAGGYFFIAFLYGMKLLGFLSPV